MLAGKGVDLRH